MKEHIVSSQTIQRLANTTDLAGAAAKAAAPARLPDASETVPDRFVVPIQ